MKNPVAVYSTLWTTEFLDIRSRIANWGLSNTKASEGDRLDIVVVRMIATNEESKAYAYEQWYASELGQSVFQALEDSLSVRSTSNAWDLVLTSKRVPY